jgi:phage terminase large subunit GpA-like protein
VRLKVWVNTKLAETWEERDGERMDEAALMTRREKYGPAIPAEVAVLTCGVDVQDDRLEIELVGWGRDEESWSCDYKIIWGDPAAPELWHELEQYLTATFEHETLSDGLHIHAACLDTGGHHTQAAYAFCRGRERQRIWAIKGLAGKWPIWPKRPTKAAKGKVNLFGVGVDAAKEAVFARLKKREHGAGFCHFPLDRDAAYFEQLTAERLRTRYVKGFAQLYWWKPDRASQRSSGLPGLCLCGPARAFSMGLNLNKRADALPPIPEARERVNDARQAVIAATTPSPRRRRAIPSNYL